MNSSEADTMLAALKPLLAQERKTYPWLPDEIIKVGNPGDGFKLSVITRKGSGIKSANDLPDSMLEKAMDTVEFLKLTADVTEFLDVKESRLAYNHKVSEKLTRS